MQQQNKKFKVSNWIEEARYLKSNRKWLQYSAEIAARILAAIHYDKKLNQARLAESLNVSTQYVSKIVKGKENLTLETIAKLSEVLGRELISFPSYEFQKNILAESVQGSLAVALATKSLEEINKEHEFILAKLTEDLRTYSEKSSPRTYTNKSSATVVNINSNLDSQTA